jgi:hypothetical protein
MKREVGIHGAKAGHEVVFECSYGTFRCVPAMDVGWYELIPNASLFEVIFEELRRLIIHHLELWG